MWLNCIKAKGFLLKSSDVNALESQLLTRLTFALRFPYNQSFTEISYNKKVVYVIKIDVFIYMK